MSRCSRHARIDQWGRYTIGRGVLRALAERARRIRVEFGKGLAVPALITAIIGSFASASVNGRHSMPPSRRCT